MRIGIFSGSFDPIHTGHAMVANYLGQYASLDEVWLMVSPLNPLKVGSSPAQDLYRLEMCSRVADNCTNVKVSDFELGLPLPTYSFKTLALLREKYPQHQFVLCIGADNWISFHKWRNYQEILNNHEIIIYPRPGYKVTDDTLPPTVTLLDDAPQALISSTFVRKIVKRGGNANYFLPFEVLEYIKEKSLYK